MVSNRQPRYTRYRIVGLLAALLALLIPYTGAWSQGTRRPVMDTHQKSVAPGLSAVVQQGRLSVDLQAADLGEVLAHIGRQANFRVVPGPSPGKRVSARFEGVELEEGIRHLLRLASLNHIFLYARRSMGAVVISEVVESAPETTSEQVSVEPTEMTRRIREVFKLGKQMGREPSDSQESSPSDPR